jgi:MarR family transcriptional regulator, organic hydroperoxide resistance regulator
MSHDLPRLQEEIQQQRPFRSPGEEAALGLWRTADLLRHHFARAIEPYGITLQQYNVLRILRGAGGDGLPTLAIAERMIERAPGITRIVDRLLAQRLVTRERSTIDRRQVVCRIASEGLALLERLEAPVAQASDTALPMLAAEEQEQLARMLDRIRAGYRAED